MFPTLLYIFYSSFVDFQIVGVPFIRLSKIKMYFCTDINLIQEENDFRIQYTGALQKRQN